MCARHWLFQIAVGLALILSAAELQGAGVDATLRGALPNGLRYVVVPHASPARDISVHLVVRCGSLDERDDERGFAHFVEHLAFSGTRNYPPSAIRVLFGRLGATIGPDVNATTGYSHTHYRFNVVDGNPQHVTQTLSVLRDFADGIAFSAEEMRREAGVVDNEARTEDTADNRFSLQFLHAVYAGTPIPQRDVLGPTGTLQAASPDRLRAFYHRNYRPQHMTIIVAGEIEGPAVVRTITELFGNLTAPNEPSRAALAPPAISGPRVALLPLKDAGESVVDFVGLFVRPPATPEGSRQELIQRLATGALNERLRVAVGQTDLFGTARAYVTAGPADALVQYGISVSTSRIFWEPAVQLAETEIRRAATNGFTAAEIARAVAEEKKQAQASVTAAANGSAAEVGGHVAQAVIEGREWRTPETELADLNQTAVTPEELKAAIATTFAPSSLRIVLVAPPSNTPKESRVTAVFNRAAGRPLRKDEAGRDVAFRYPDFGTPGTVAQRQVEPDLALTLVTFNNGVQLNVRTSAAEPGRFRLRLQFPGGIAQLDKTQAGVPQVAAYLFAAATPRRQTDEEIAALFAERDIEIRLAVAIGTPILDLAGPRESLGFALGWLAAMFSDLRIEDADLNQAVGRFRDDLQRIASSGFERARWESLRLFSGNDPRLAPRLTSGLENLPGQANYWLTRQMLAGPLEIGVVTDGPAEEAITLAAKTVGTLKKRGPPPKSRAPLTGPKKAERQETPAVTGDKTAIARILWPVSLPETAQTEAALQVAADVFRDRLVLVLRESLGATYVAQTSFERDAFQRDFAFLAMTSTFQPDKVRQLTLGCIQLAAQLAEHGILPEEFARLREPLRVHVAGNLRDNGWWLENVVAVAQRRPEVLEFARHYEQAVVDLTPEDVNAALRTFRPDRAIAVVVRPAAAK